MSDARPVKVCIDAMGGDHAPDAVLAGIIPALDADATLGILLTGPPDVVEPFADARPGRVVAVPTTEIITMDEHPASAVRTKRDSSMVVGARLVKEGRADAFFSAGSTGAAMAAATLIMGRMTGVSRPAIATVLPTSGSPVVLLDAGANADCRPENLLQFAIMGTAYASVVLGVENPRVGLVNIGGEPSKGSQLAIETYGLLAEAVPGFVGNLEPNHLLDGMVDVAVTDGFTGNVILKLLEGTSRTLLEQLRDAMTSSTLRKAAAAIVKPELVRLRSRLDPENYGGAPLLGVNGVCIVGHGSSTDRAVTAAVGVAARAVRGGLMERIAASLSV